MIENKYIDKFFSANNVAERYKALLDLSKHRKQIHEAAKSPHFESALESLFRDARVSGKKEDILMAVAAIARVSSIIKSYDKNAEEILKRNITQPLPSVEIINNPDDRYYVAKACNLILPEWVAEYLAHATIVEESAEKARAEYIVGLFRSVNNLQTAFEMLLKEFTNWTNASERPTDSAAKKLKRVMSAIRPAILDFEGNINSDIGKSFARMIRAPFRRGLEVLDQKTRKELASEVAATIHNLIRTRFSLATEPSIYEAMILVKQWFPHYRWEDFIKSSNSVQKVASDIIEGMTLLVRQGIIDETMFNSLTLVLGSEDNARRKTTDLSHSILSLRDDIRSWLITGQTKSNQMVLEVSDLALQSAEHRENQILASILQDIERIDQRTIIFLKEYLDEIEVLNPKIAKEIKNILEHVRVVEDGFRSFIKGRGLRVRDKINDVVEFSPLAYESVSGANKSIRSARVIVPVVEIVNNEGVPSIIRKGLVEQVD